MPPGWEHALARGERGGRDDAAAHEAVKYAPPSCPALTASAPSAGPRNPGSVRVTCAQRCYVRVGRAPVQRARGAAARGRPGRSGS